MGKIDQKFDLSEGIVYKFINSLLHIGSKKIAFIMMGNAAEIKLFVKLPRDFESYFKNTFYTTFTTSDLVEVDKVLLGTDRNYMGMSNDAVLKLKDDFSNDEWNFCYISGAS